jgi:hypothetical protein
VSLNKRTRGKTQFSTPFFFADTTSSTGGGLSGVTSASPGLVMEYRRQGQSTWTSVTPQSGKTLGIYFSGGIVADGSLDGAYEVDFPDAAFASASGVEWVALRVRGVANILATTLVIELDAVDYQDAAAFGLSRLTDIETDTQNIQSRIPAALVSGRMDAYIGATANNVITNNTIASNAIGNSQLATSAINAIQSGLATSTQAGAIETDTQNIQSRLPTALVDGRMAANAQVVGDKEGYKLASDGLALVTAWTVGITGNITGNLSGSVGSISGVTFPANFAALVITEGGAIDHVDSVSVVDELGQQALSANSLDDEIATAVADIQVLSRLDSMIESDGTGQFRFDTIALENAPAGAGGAGGTDWNANERTAFRTILGFNSSGDILDPSSGILDTIRDQTALITSGGTVYVTSPVTATGQLASPLIIGDDYLAANGRRFRWTVALPSGYVIATSTARFGMRYEDDEGVNSFVATGTVTDATGGNVHLDFDVAKTVTGTLRPGWYEWSIEIVSGSGVEITRVKSGKNAEWQEKQT